MNAKTGFISALAAGTVALGFAQAPTILYLPGKLIKDQNIGLRSWGSGSIRETTEAAFEGTTSISVSTRNPFQGGILMYGNPVDLSPLYGSTDNLLRITFRPADSSMVFGPGAGSAPGGGGKPGFGAGTGAKGGSSSNGQDGFDGGRGGGQGSPPGFGPGSGPGGPSGGPRPPGAGAGPGGGTPKEQELKNLRVIVTTTDGKKSEVYVPLSSSLSGERGWRMVSIPLRAIRGFDATNKTIKELAFSGDATTTLYIGDMRVVNDSTKISGEIVQKGPVNLALGDELTLSAYGFGGSSPLKYEWDFDAADGIQADAEGQTIKRKFRKAGHYTVTLTVRDTYGLKAPATSTLDVNVNP